MQNLDQGEESSFARVPADHRRDVLTNTRMRTLVMVPLLLALSTVPSLAARYATKTPKRDYSHPSAPIKKAPPVSFDYRRGNSNWPYGPGYNVPYPDRPYGDPGHGGE